MVNDIGHEQYHQKDLIWSPSWRPRPDSTRRDGHCGRWVKCGGIVVAQNVHSPHGSDRGGETCRIGTFTMKALKKGRSTMTTQLPISVQGTRLTFMSGDTGLNSGRLCKTCRNSPAAFGQNRRNARLSR